MDKDVHAIIKRFRAILEKNGTRVQKLILFGSHARQCSHEGSDIDIVIISQDFKNKDFWQRTDIITEAVYEIFEPIEALAYTPEEWEKSDSIISSIVKESGISV